MTVKYDANVFTADEIEAILQIAGYFVGIGEWRPYPGGGCFGTFTVQKEES